jgi:HK97 family phage prohead protease
MDKTQNQIERRYLTCVSSKVMPDTRMVTLEERQGDNGNSLPKIVGYTSVFGVTTEIDSWFGSWTEQIEKGAFLRAIREKQDVRALRNHQPDNLLGRTSAKTLTLEEDDVGLFIRVDTPDTSVGRDTVESIKRGDLSGMSFAFIVRGEEWINGENGSPDMRIIKDVDLFDVGPVTYPAYVETTADLRDNSLIHRRGLAELGKPIDEKINSLLEKKDDVVATEVGNENTMVIDLTGRQDLKNQVTITSGLVLPMPIIIPDSNMSQLRLRKRINLQQKERMLTV